jgi:antibiotic biosynthesis monooxygenase (ABM) superfamily enzyme
MNQQEPVTVVINRNVRQGSEQAFEEAVKAWIPKLLAYPGHLGVNMLRPMPGSREYRAVLKFRSREEWQAFQHSPEYQQFVETIRPLLETDPQVETASGLESWFTPLGARVLRVPPRWKMAIVTWIGVCLTVYLVTLLFSPVTGQWPWFLGFITINAGVVAGLTWIVMPVLNRLCTRWLQPESEHKRSNQ